MRDCPYYVYSSHKTYRNAEDALEDYYSVGEICEAERPYISSDHIQICANGVVSWAYRYRVMFPTA